MITFKKYVIAGAISTIVLMLAGCDIDYVDETYRPAPQVTVTPQPVVTSSAYYGPPPSAPEPASTSSASYGPPPVIAETNTPTGSSASYGPPPTSPPSVTVTKAPDDKSAPAVTVTTEANKDQDAPQAVPSSSATYGG